MRGIGSLAYELRRGFPDRAPCSVPKPNSNANSASSPEPSPYAISGN